MGGAEEADLAQPAGLEAGVAVQPAVGFDEAGVPVHPWEEVLLALGEAGGDSPLVKYSRPVWWAAPAALKAARP